MVVVVVMMVVVMVVMMMVPPPEMVEKFSGLKSSVRLRLGEPGVIRLKCGHGVGNRIE
ncbi:MAG TPA: hypothetical protein VGJ20_17395 [Xanthobacteraceae bacterium]